MVCVIRIHCDRTVTPEFIVQTATSHVIYVKMQGPLLGFPLQGAGLYHLIYVTTSVLCY